MLPPPRRDIWDYQDHSESFCAVISLCPDSAGSPADSLMSAHSLRILELVFSPMPMRPVIDILFCHVTISPSNQSPEPTAVIAVSSAIAAHAASRRWLSFHR
jgi:hypothetical protein